MVIWARIYWREFEQFQANPTRQLVPLLGPYLLVATDNAPFWDSSGMFVVHGVISPG